MTLPRFHDLTTYWKDWPPTHISAAAITAALGGTSNKKGNNRSKEGDEEGYEPPNFEGTNDLTHMLSPASPFGDAFEPAKMRVVEIDNTKKPETT